MHTEVLLHLLHHLLHVSVLLHLGDDVLPPRVELVDAAHLQVQLLDLPELQVVREVEDADLVQDVEAVSSVEVEDAVEGGGVAVEVDLVLGQRIRVNLRECLLAL